MTLGKVGAPNAAVYTASKARRRRFDQGGGEGKAHFLQSVPVKRAASPQEIADTILFLACKAPFLTGS